jgi:hypothetical protein
MSQSNANKWLHVLHPVWNQALADHGLLPARTADDLAAMLTTSPTEASAPASLFFMMGLHAPSRVRKTRRSSKNITASTVVIWSGHVESYKDHRPLLGEYLCKDVVDRGALGQPVMDEDQQLLEQRTPLVPTGVPNGLDCQLPTIFVLEPLGVC